MTAGRIDPASTQPAFASAVQAFAPLAAQGLQWAVVIDSARGAAPHILAPHRLGTAALTAGSHIRLGSVSKLVVGRICHDLVQAGRLDAQARCDLSGATLADLLTHRTGLRDALEDPAFRAIINADVTRPVPLDPVIAASLALPRAEAVPRYANINAILAARLCEIATGQSCADLMAAAGLPFALTEAAHLPAPHPEGWRWGLAPGRIEYGRHLFRATHYNPAWAGAAGAMVARIADLAAFAAMLAPLCATAPQDGYHWLARVDRGWLHHAGDVPGFSCWVGRECATGRLIAAAAGMCWIPDHGNAAHLLAQSMGAP